MLKELKEDLEDAYQKREEVLKKRRGVFPLAQEGVKSLLRGDIERGKEKEKELKEIIDECEKLLQDYPVLKDKSLGKSYQEYVELVLVREFIENGLKDIPKLNVPIKYFLTGLGDSIGEIKRIGIDELAEGNIERAEEIEKKLESIYEEFNKFRYPNSIVPGLKRKQDIARKVINSLHDSIVSAKISKNN